MKIALKEYGVEKLKPGDVLYYTYSHSRSLITDVKKGKASPIIFIRPAHDDSVIPYEWSQSNRSDLSVAGVYVEVAK